MQLRPVTFHYKQDQPGQRQYGLIAEEVVSVYPELVVKGAKGEVESVQYRELIPMLLNELQRQQRKLSTQDQRLSVQSQRLDQQSQQLAELKAQNNSLRAALVGQHEAITARLERLERASFTNTIARR